MNSIAHARNEGNLYMILKDRGVNVDFKPEEYDEMDEGYGDDNVNNKLAKRNQQQPNSQELEKVAFKFFSSPKIDNAIDSMLAKLTPQQINDLKSKLGGINEEMGGGNDFSSFLDMVHSAEEVSGLNEAYQREVGPIQNEVGKILSTFGVINIMGMGMIPALVIAALDAFTGTNLGPALGYGGMVGSVPASLIAGGILWKIGKRLQGFEGDLGNEPLF